MENEIKIQDKKYKEFENKMEKNEEEILKLRDIKFKQINKIN